MLSLQQQETIENSLWVVNTALKRQGLQADDDLRQSAILYMCKCLESFDPTKNIKWTTYAYKNVFLFIRRTHGKEMRKLSMVVEDDIYDIKEPLKIPLEEPLVSNESKYRVERIKAILDPKERQILELKLQGYKFAEIGELMGWSISKVNNCMRAIKEKARDIRL